MVEAVVAIGQPAIGPLLELYDEVGPKDGSEIAFLLAGIGVHEDRILRLLLNRLDAAWNDTLFHLEVYRDPAAIAELETRLEKVDGEQRLDLRDTIRDLRNPHAPTHLSEFDIFDPYPEKGEPNYDLATEAERIEYLDSPSVDDRANAALTFFSDEYSIQARAKLLERAQHDPEAAVRARCWEAFFDQTDDPELRRMMLQRLGNPETPDEERAGLALALCRHSDQISVRKTILKLAEDPATRAKAVEAMWRSFDPVFGPAAAAYLNDPDEDVQRNAIWAVGYLNVTSHAAALKDFFDSSEFRSDALHNYALVAPGPTTRKRVWSMLEKIEEMAAGLTNTEAEAVKAGLDIRLGREGLDPVFTGDAEPEIEPVETRTVQKVGRNEPCPCGSGKKYKKCCGQ